MSENKISMLKWVSGGPNGVIRKIMIGPPEAEEYMVNVSLFVENLNERDKLHTASADGDTIEMAFQSAYNELIGWLA